MQKREKRNERKARVEEFASRLTVIEESDDTKLFRFFTQLFLNFYLCV
jgi:hypothetical protein